MIDQLTKAKIFQDFHARPEPLLLPNPWDAGSARLMASLGFEALATTSAGVAFIDGVTATNAEDVLANCRVVCEATDLPVNADLENCFADAPEEAASLIARACEAGVVGGSIEDATGDRDAPIYDFTLTVERVQAAVEVARGLPIPFTLTARAEGLLHGRGDLDDIIKRLRAFEEAGADCLYAPGLKTIEEMRIVMDAVSKPVNVVMGFADPSITLAELAEIGVRRVSIGAGLARIALGAMMTAATEMKNGGFTFVGDMVPFADLARGFRAGAAAD